VIRQVAAIEAEVEGPGLDARLKPAGETAISARGYSRWTMLKQVHPG